MNNKTNRKTESGVSIRVEMIRQLTLVLLLAAELIIFAFMTQNFFTTSNMINVLRQVSITGISSLGMFMIILLGDIDLSVGSMYAFIGVISAIVFKTTESTCLTLIVALALGIAIGLFNGIFTAKFRVPAFITTLATICDYLQRGGYSRNYCDKKMKAIVFKDLATWTYEERSVPEIKKVNDVLVEVEAASICGTDVHVLGNPPGFIGTKGSILGHECVGTVREIGDGVEGLKVGDRVVLVPNIPCGYCESCRQGKANMCENEKVMGVTCDGVFAKYFVAPEVALTKIPDDMDKDLAIFAEPVKCVMGAMDWVRVLPGETVLILGGGPIGLYFIMLMKANGAGKIIVSEPSEYRAKYAMDCGADIIIDPTKQNLAEEIAKITSGRGVDISVDAVGVLINDAIVNTCKGGRIVLMGQNGAVNETICQNDIVSKGLSIFGNYIGNYIMSRTVKTLEAGIIPVEKIITHKLPMSKFAEGLDAMRKGVGLEVILYPDEN